MTNRKDIRITISGKRMEKFNQAKAKAEAGLGLSLRDNEFASRVLNQAISESTETVTVAANGDVLVHKSNYTEPDKSVPAPKFLSGDDL